MSHLVGGISSAGRALPLLDGRPLLVHRSAGPYVWDEAGARYIDTALGFGATVLGHAHPSIVEAVTRALANGSMPAFAHRSEEAAAAALTEATGELSRVVFTSTGSEAVHLACRIARVVTGRKTIAKMAAGFDGWYDDVAFGNAGSPEAAMQANARPTSGHTTLLRFNDFEDAEMLFAESGDIAAVILEPMLANSGCIMPAPGYLPHLEKIARRHGAVVILDEVLTGFRTRFGLLGATYEVAPDLATVGKAIGSGIAVAGVIGTPAVMEACERGLAVRAGTYSGNPVATAAVTATMGILRELDYAVLLELGDRLRAAIETGFGDAGIPLSTSGLGTVFSTWFDRDPPTTYAEAIRKANAVKSLSLHLEMRRRATLTMPFPFGRIFLSAAHDEAIMSELAATFAGAALAIRAAA